MQARVIDDRFVGVPCDHGSIGFKWAIIQADGSNEQQLKIISGPTDGQGQKTFYALFTNPVTDFKIKGINESSWRVRCKYTTHLKPPKGGFVYRPGSTWVLPTLDSYNDGEGEQYKLRFISQNHPQGRAYVQQMAGKYGSMDEASKAVSELKVEFHREKQAGQNRSGSLYICGSIGLPPGCIVRGDKTVENMQKTSFDPDTSFNVEPFKIIMCMAPESLDWRPTLL